VVTVSGEVDFATAPQLREELLRLTAAGSERIVVNLDPSPSLLPPGWESSSAG
jgi:anti-anti-sigma regulatory factor